MRFKVIAAVLLLSLGSCRRPIPVLVITPDAEVTTWTIPLHASNRALVCVETFDSERRHCRSVAEVRMLLTDTLKAHE